MRCRRRGWRSVSRNPRNLDWFSAIRGCASESADKKHYRANSARYARNVSEALCFSSSQRNRDSQGSEASQAREPVRIDPPTGPSLSVAGADIPNIVFPQIRSGVWYRLPSVWKSKIGDSGSKPRISLKGLQMVVASPRYRVRLPASAYLFGEAA